MKKLKRDNNNTKRKIIFWATAEFHDQTKRAAELSDNSMAHVIRAGTGKEVNRILVQFSTDVPL